MVAVTTDRLTGRRIVTDPAVTTLVAPRVESDRA
jgi:hypothetical protein